MAVREDTEPFPSSKEMGAKTYWYFKSFMDRAKLGREIKRLKEMGYKTYVITSVHIDALYTYPQTRYGAN